MSQPPWGQPSGRGTRWAQPPQANPYGWPGQARSPWGQPQGRPSPYGLGFGSAPQRQTSPYGFPPGRAPRRRRRSPLGLLLLAAIVIGLVSMAGNVVGDVATPEPPTGGYQNDQYQVPPADASPPALPQPETYEEAETLLTDNPFYSQTVPAPVRCDQDQIDVSSASDRQLKAHFEELMECLVRVWQPPVEAARWQIVRPTVTIYGREITTKCGKAEVNAFYCGADQQVYYSNLLDDSVPIVAQNEWAADVVLAHEFGHALQARTAILISSSALGQQSKDESTQLLFSRRLETQADCLSGMFMRSVSASLGLQQSDMDSVLDVYTAVGDDTLSGRANIEGNHGLARSRKYWGGTGLGTGEVGECNTYQAESRLVR